MKIKTKSRNPAYQFEKPRGKKLLIAAIVILLLFGAGGFILSKRSSNQVSNNQIIEKVSEKYSLNDEDKKQAKAFQIKNLSDSEKNSNTVYTNVQNDDWIVSVPTKKKAIIYRASEDKIIRIDSIVDKEQANSENQNKQ